MEAKDEHLKQQARMVLDFNWTGEYTKPSPRLYPHQWSWDSAFIAMGYATYDTGRARRELGSLFAGQWSNGLLPHIIFNPELNNYFPGSRVWRTGGSPDAPQGRRTSGVVQPPAHAIAALRAYQRAAGRGEQTEGKELLEQVYPGLLAWHDYLHRERDPDGGGLVYIRHPWESGMDNSPLWDQILQRITLRPSDVPDYERVDVNFTAAEERPVNAEYDRYIYLVGHAADCGYDERGILRDAPFAVQDVLFNSLLCAADRDLSEIARPLGDDPAPHEERARRVATAMNERLWSEERGLYLGFDLAAGEPLRVYDALSSFLPLYAGVPDERRAERLVSNLENSGFCMNGQGGYPAPSYDRHGFGFSPARYWRGPVWVNTNWLLMHGLRRYGFEAQARRLRETILNLVEASGFYEYFHPSTGRGHGSDFFSWTAALLLDVLCEDEP